jgi:hypothetical protein
MIYLYIYNKMLIVFVHKKINKIFKMYDVVIFILTVRRGYILCVYVCEAAQCFEGCRVSSGGEGGGVRNKITHGKKKVVF